MGNNSGAKIQVGLIGYGMAGQVFHAPFIHSVPGLELARIRESRPANMELARQRYPEARITAQVEDLLQDDALDVLVVATPNSSHFELTKRALLAGKHVIVEKPFTPTSAEADELIQLAKEQQRLLTVFHNRRWDSDFKTVHKVLASGVLGSVVEYEAHFDRFRTAIRENTWKEEDTPGSGILYDLGSHLIDQALVLFGLPQEVYAELKVQRPHSRIIDKFEARLYYERVTVTLSAGLLVREPSPRYTLHGDRGSFLKYGLDVQEEALKAGKSPEGAPAWGVEPEHLWGHLNTDFQGLPFKGRVESEAGDYRGFYENVRDALLGEKELNVQPEQARDVIRVIELAERSSNEKRRFSFYD
ncbi:oxidoreductase [Rufibacter ruber]|uniref:oxidoreductase n=1 Tax=Rufibacter ruber TaxID=1783499 RepID=UPI000832F1F0|nr:oxidoreductase [Rufibacter ruber]